MFFYNKYTPINQYKKISLFNRCGFVGVVIEGFVIRRELDGTLETEADFFEELAGGFIIGGGDGNYVVDTQFAGGVLHGGICCFEGIAFAIVLGQEGKTYVDMLEGITFYKSAH